jgi:hypothetical protein
VRRSQGALGSLLNVIAAVSQADCWARAAPARPGASGRPCARRRLRRSTSSATREVNPDVRTGLWSTAGSDRRDGPRGLRRQRQRGHHLPRPAVPAAGGARGRNQERKRSLPGGTRRGEAFSFRVYLRRGAGAYVCGEDLAAELAGEDTVAAGPPAIPTRPVQRQHWSTTWSLAPCPPSWARARTGSARSGGRGPAQALLSHRVRRPTCSAC